MKYLKPCLHIKSVEANGEVCGYASVFDEVDSYGDIVTHGAFRASIENFHKGKMPKLLWQHDVNCPIGIIEEIKEDQHGLFVKCRLLLEVEKAKDVYCLIKNKAIDGFSIGYKLRDSYFENGYHYLTDVDLLEISIVTFPACESAVIEDVKSQANVLKNINTINQLIKGYIK